METESVWWLLWNSIKVCDHTHILKKRRCWANKEYLWRTGRPVYAPKKALNWVHKLCVGLPVLCCGTVHICLRNVTNKSITLRDVTQQLQIQSRRQKPQFSFWHLVTCSSYQIPPTNFTIPHWLIDYISQNSVVFHSSANQSHCLYLVPYTLYRLWQ